MAITFDSISTSAQDAGLSSPFSWNHTITGINPLLVVGIGMDNTGLSVNGINYNSVPLTKIQDSTIGGAMKISFWYLAAPATGTHAIDVTMSGTGNTGGFGLSLNGINQTAPLDNSVTNSGATSTSASTILATKKGNTVIIDMVGIDNLGSSGTPVGPNIERVDSQVETWGALVSSTLNTPKLDTYTLGWTINSSNWASIAASFIGDTAPINSNIYQMQGFQ